MSKNKKTIGGVLAAGAALTGAALGAAAVMLSDKKNQAKIKNTIDEISHDAVELGKSIKNKAETLAKNSQKKNKTRATVHKVSAIPHTAVKKPSVKRAQPKKPTTPAKN